MHVFVYYLCTHGFAFYLSERINQVENPKSVDHIVQTYLNEFFDDEDSRVGVTAAVRFQYYRPRSNLSNATRNAISTINVRSFVPLSFFSVLSTKAFDSDSARIDRHTP